jgi:microcystin-dependent protein
MADDIAISQLTPRNPTSSAVVPYYESGETYSATLTQIRQIAAAPQGLILIWSGSIASIPTGWNLCDGSTVAGYGVVPDLRDRFIAGSGSTYALKATGGSRDSIVVAHTHTGTAGAHTHSANVSVNTGAGNYAACQSRIRPCFGVTFYGGSTTGSTDATTPALSIDSQGSSGINANLPPYLALAYIIKV